MLLVDDDQAEAVELYFFLDQGVGADDKLCLTAIDEAAVVAFSIFVERAGEQDDARLAAGAFEELARGEEMLGGEDLGGRHERGLVAVFHGDEHGLEGDDGFAGADVALQQAAHGTGLAHVRRFRRGISFARWWDERQDLADGFADFVGGGEGNAGALTACGGA